MSVEVIINNVPGFRRQYFTSRKNDKILWGMSVEVIIKNIGIRPLYTLVLRVDSRSLVEKMSKFSGEMFRILHQKYLTMFTR